jgi:hypothetical protein
MTTATANAVSTPDTPASTPVHVHWQSTPDTFTLLPPCTITDYIPKVGVCSGTGNGTAALTGDWQGTLIYAFAFVTNPKNLTPFGSLETDAIARTPENQPTTAPARAAENIQERRPALAGPQHRKRHA